MSLAAEHPPRVAGMSDRPTAPSEVAILDLPLTLAPGVSVREEPFGALAYDSATRRLTFLKRPALLAVLRGLDGIRPARASVSAAGIPSPQWPAYAAALRALHTAAMLYAPESRALRPSPPAPTASPLAPAAPPPATASRDLTAQMETGLAAPICLTWELTYGCNLACRHCLSSSGRRDPAELSTQACEALIDELAGMGVFYVNIGGGEPTLRPDFWHLLDYAVARRVGVKFSTNGSRITPGRAARIAATDYVDVQVSLDGATAAVNDALRGPGSHRMALTALATLAAAGVTGAKLSVVVTRDNVDQLDQFQQIADDHDAVLRLTRLRPSGRGAAVWDELHLTADQQRSLHAWLVAAGDRVLTGDSFFHLSALGEALPGLNLCGAGRVVCLIDPVGDVYACPFAIHERFAAGSVLGPGGFTAVWRESATFTSLREPGTGGGCTSCSAYDACRGGCMAAKFFTGLPLDGPDPECVRGASEAALAQVRTIPMASADHSRTTPVGLPMPVLRR